MKPNTHALLLGALLWIVSQPVLHAQLPNAWQVTDGSINSGSAIHYTTNLLFDQQVAATNGIGGFRLAVNARFVSELGGPYTMALGYGTGPRRYLIWLELDANNDLAAKLDAGGTPIPLTTNGAGTFLYHTHEIIYDGASAGASYRFDGREIAADWTGTTFPLDPGRVFWGAGSSSGRGKMNFNSVTFEITNTVVASYNAGTEGSPVVAPDPMTQGWMVSTSTPSIGSFVTDVSPDTALLPVVVTLPADQFQPGSVRLNGEVDPGGLSSLVWFEWGAGTNYNNTTGFIQNVPPGAGWTDVRSTLNNIPAGFEFNYRLVASNSFGAVAGDSASFRLGFIETTPSGLPGVHESSVAWGDYNNDGQLDFLLTGEANPGGNSEPVSELWGNTGSGFGKEIVPGLPDVQRGSVAWGDFDNDNRLDFILTGYNGSSGLSQLWRNTGSGFSNVSIPGLPGVQSGSVAWGDYDNDGRLDLLLSGDDGSGGITQLWQNTGSGFANVTLSVAPTLPGVSASSVAWGDYDSDGWLDFLLTGTTNGLFSGSVSQLWRNTGGSFSNVTTSVSSGLPGVSSGSVAWGNYDNDERLDFLLTGRSIAQLWGISEFGLYNVTEAGVTPDLPQVSLSSAAWGDFDNSGRLDFLLTGISDNMRVSQVWQRMGGGYLNETMAFAPGLPGVMQGSVAWSDYDNDGRLDFLLTGMHDTRRVSQLWRNLFLISNSPPAAPSGLAASIVGPQATPILLSWNASTDDHTPPTGLSYNIRVGTAPGISDVVSPQARTNGFRLVPEFGNTWMRTNALLNLPPGTYYWSVQAIDTAFTGGPFAPEASFQVNATGPILSIVRAIDEMLISWEPDDPGFLLQENAHLNPAAWTNSPSLNTNPIAVPSSGATRFYRLRQSLRQ